MVVTLNNSVYRMGKISFKAALAVAKEKFVKDNENAIYAVSKAGQAEFRHITYDTADELYEEMKQLKAKGFKVYFNLKV